MKKIVFEGKLLKLFTRRVRLPNSYVVDLEIIEHPGAVLVIPFLTKNKIILLKQFRPVLDSYIYELPAGTLETRESPVKCAKREIIEETGYSAGKITKLGAIFPVPGYSTEKIVIFKAEHLKKENRLVQADEVIEPFIVTKPAVRKLFKEGKLVDAKTICALSFCGWL
jgi:ADP-ribose pyrophosphatase